ncbi:Hypothetical protein A7982_09399 [Minicystis rosea]|nr:Hypothetical protein A7982_09399 [Minicystis rosea]
MRLAWLTIGALSLLGCNGVSADRGLDAWMVVSGAQFFAGSMPEAQDGPPVAAIDLSSNYFTAGEIDKPLRGALDPAATAAAVGLTGDRGHWIIPAGLPDVTAPGFPTFDVTLSFAPSVPAGPYDLVVRAVDESDRFGPPETLPLTASAAPSPAGALVISLRWDTNADLDVHVVLPGGGVIWKGDITEGGGLLDADSNAACVIDGRRREHVVFADPPAAGHYAVLVDTFSLCDETFANWEAEARLDGKLVGHVAGESLPTDTYVTHDRGAGVLAIEFDVP